jgi:hypothetical protein
VRARGQADGQRAAAPDGNAPLRATAHEGGTGNARGVDNNLHITLKVGSISYHLRCKEAPALHIIHITR